MLYLLSLSPFDSDISKFVPKSGEAVSKVFAEGPEINCKVALHHTNTFIKNY